MSPIALTLNLALGLLLVGAMILGLRLDRKLRALRESHSGFAKAVAELDQAAARTQAGLEALRATAEETRTALAERIEDAERLSVRLAKHVAEAQTRVDTLAKYMPLSRPTPVRETPAAATAPEPAASTAKPVAPVRSRATVDDELFETAARPVLSALAGGRR